MQGVDMKLCLSSSILVERDSLLVLLVLLSVPVHGGGGGSVPMMSRFLAEFSGLYLGGGPGRYVIMSLEEVVWRDAGVKAVHREAHLPVMVVGPDASPHVAHNRRLAGCVVAGQRGYVEDVVRRVQSLPQWSPHTRVLALLSARLGVDITDVHKLLSFFWSQSAAKVVVAADGGDDNLSLYTMEPFRDSRGLCGQGDLRVTLAGSVLLRQLRAGQLRPTLRSLALYREVVPRDLGGCTVRASLSNGIPARCGRGSAQEGLDARVLRNIFETAAHYHNFRPAVAIDEVRYDSRERFPNGTFTSRLKFLEPGLTDVVLGPYTYTLSRMRRLRPSLPFLVDSAVVTVRCSARTSSQEGGGAARGATLLHLVSRLQRARLLPLLAAAVLLTVVALLLVDRVMRAARPAALPARPARTVAWGPPPAASSRPRLPSLLWFTLLVWSALCEVSVPVPSHVANNVPGRIVVLSWLLFVLNFNVALRGLLAAHSTAHSTTRISSVEELRHSDIVVGYPSLTYTSILRQELMIPEERTFLCVDNLSYICEERFNNEENFAVLQTAQMPVSMTCLTECHYTIPSAVRHTSYLLYMRKDYPLARLFDRVILRLQQAGLITSWLARARQRATPYGQSPARSPGKPNFREAFVCLACGLSASVVAFILETCCQKIQFMCLRTRLSPMPNERANTNKFE